MGIQWSHNIEKDTQTLPCRIYAAGDPGGRCPNMPTTQHAGRNMQVTCCGYTHPGRLPALSRPSYRVRIVLEFAFHIPDPARQVSIRFTSFAAIFPSPFRVYPAKKAKASDGNPGGVHGRNEFRFQIRGIPPRRVLLSRRAVGSIPLTST